jgi:hypothetical protein
MPRRTTKAVSKMDAGKCRAFTVAIEAEIGGSTEVVEYRRDPKVPQTYAVRTKSDGCYLVSCGYTEDGSYEVIDSFELEDGQESLADLEVGAPRFF